MRYSTQKKALLLIYLFATVCNGLFWNFHRCRAEPESRQASQIDLDEQVPQLKGELLQEDLRQLAKHLIDTAVARGQEDKIEWLQEILDRETNFAEKECIQIVQVAAKVANSLRNSNHFEQADTIALLIIEILKQRGEERTSNAAMMLTLRGVIASDCEQHDESRQLLLDALKIYVELDLADSKSAKALWYYLGQEESKVGSLDRAEEIYEELLKQACEENEVVGECLALACLSEISVHRGKLDHAEMLLEKIYLMDKKETTAGTGASYIASRFAILESHLGEYARANKHMEMALQVATEKKGFLSVLVARRRKDYADILLMQGKAAQAHEQLQQAIETRIGLHGKEHAAVRELEDQLHAIESKPAVPNSTDTALKSMAEQLQGVVPARYGEVDR